MSGHPILGVTTATPKRAGEGEETIRMGRRRGPADLADYDDLLRELRRLVAMIGVSHRDLVRRDGSGTLRRSTVGAVLRGDRLGTRDVVIAIVRACGVTGVGVEDWAADWDRVGQPRRDRMERWARRPGAVGGWHHGVWR